jgi:hypothetical protein
VQYFNARSLGAVLAASGFEPPEWLPSSRFRQGPAGGAMKKRIGRTVARTIAAVARNQTLFVAATR